MGLTFRVGLMMKEQTLYDAEAGHGETLGARIPVLAIKARHCVASNRKGSRGRFRRAPHLPGQTHTGICRGC